jgi:hypothetical protein
MLQKKALYKKLEGVGERSEERAGLARNALVAEGGRLAPPPHPHR